MQAKTADPRSGYTDGEIEDALSFAGGGRVRWGVDWRNGSTDPSAVRIIETTAAQWDAGDHYGTESRLGGLTVALPEGVDLG